MAFEVPPPGARWRARLDPDWIFLGVLLALVGSLTLGSVYMAVTTTVSVLMVTKTVHQGEVIKQENLEIVPLVALNSGQSSTILKGRLKTVPADKLDEVVGTTALMDMFSGTLVHPNSYGKPVVAAGKVQIGLRLAAGRLPTVELPTGTHVKLIGLSGGNEPGKVIEIAVVVSPPQEDSDGSRLLTVEITEPHEGEVAQLAAANRLVVVRGS